MPAPVPDATSRKALHGRLALVLFLLATLLPGLQAASPTPAHAATIAGPSRYVPLTPFRLLDTRYGIGAASTQRLPPGGTISVPIAGNSGVPEGATAAVVNISIVGAKGSGHVSAYPYETDGGRGSSVLGHTAATPIIATLATVP